MIALWPFLALDAAAAGYLLMLALAALLPAHKRAAEPQTTGTERSRPPRPERE